MLRHPDAVYNLGDLVGYGAQPNETIALIRERGIPTIMGNYDDGVGFDRDDCGCAYKDQEEAPRASSRSSGRATSPRRRTRPTCAPSSPRSASRRRATLPPGAWLAAADE